jgi:hypothetical protein
MRQVREWNVNERSDCEETDMDELTLLRQIGDEAGSNDDAKQRTLARLVDAIDETAFVPSIGQADRGRRRARRALLPALAAAVAGILALGVLLPSGKGGSAPASAAVVLNRAAVVAAAQPRTELESGQLFYTKLDGESLSILALSTSEQLAALVPITREDWIAADGSGAIRSTRGDPAFLSEQDRAEYEALLASGETDLLKAGTSRDTLGPDEAMSVTSYEDLPTDPEVLWKMIQDRDPLFGGGAPGLDVSWQIIEEHLTVPYVPPAVRAALYQVAANFPGVELLGTVEDRLGRSGIGVAYANDGQRESLIFDPDTSEVISQETTVTEAGYPPGVAPGTTIGWAVYERGVVDAIGQRPE